MLSVSENPDPQSPQLTRRLVDHHDHHLDLSNPPSFSIRDYVFSARSKDVKKNWPFSLKNLQLCLKHGVKDVLPPFQSVDAIRTQVCRSSTVDNNPESDIIVNGKPVLVESVHKDEAQLTVGLKLCVDAATTNSCRSGESNLFPSTTTSVCQSEIEELVLTNKSSSSLETSSNTKAQTTVRGSGKNKCKLIVKFGSNSDRNSAEDIASNCTTQSEAMASKVCPVCKTFSSSSNTTLNAHIDQCLSVESSTPKWTVDSKLVSTRHRVKPRKMRLMVDIYATALPCTLEDLDRRNGSNWASKLPTSGETAEEEKEKRAPSSVSIEDHIADVGSVYIDSNGIKLRILSKSSDDTLQVSKLMKHLRPRKPFKGTKFLSARNKKRCASKLTRYLKLAQTKKLLSTKTPYSSRISEGQEKKNVGQGISNEVVQKQANINPGSCGTLRQWACSKRSGVAKKLNNKMRPKRNWNLSPQDHMTNIRTNSSLVQNHEKDDLSGNPVSEVAERSRGTTEPGSSVSVATNVRKERRFTEDDDDDDDDDYRMLIPSEPSAVASVPTDNSDPQPCVSTRSCHTSTSKPIKVSVSSVLSSNNCSDLKKSNPRSIDPWDSETVGQPYDQLVHSFASNHQSPGLNVGQDAEAVLPFQYHPHGHVVENMDSCVEEHRSALCSSGPSCFEEEMFYGVQLGNDTSAQDLLVNCEVANGMTTVHVDPIPIPGPPGSFLPSPRDMGSEDFQGNSSLTTSRVQSSQDQQYDFVDRDSSDSPVSATSTVSNSTAGRYDLKHTEALQFAVPHPLERLAGQAKMKSSFSDGSVDSPSENAAVVQRSSILVPEFNEPCRCQRKERVSVSSSQESQLMWMKMGYPSASEIGPTMHVASQKFTDRNAVSPANSILRLMGKNLMVVNRDQDPYSVPGWQPQQEQVIHGRPFHPHSRPSVGAGYSFPNHHVGGDGRFVEPTPLHLQRRISSSNNNNNNKRQVMGAPIERSIMNEEIITIDDSPSPETDASHHHLYASQSLLPIPQFVQSARQASASCTLDGFGVPQQPHQFMAASPSASRGHLRSSLYNCQSSLL